MSPLLKDPLSPLGKARIVVVEGDDEFHLLIWLLEHMGTPGVIEIRPPYADVATLDEYLAMLSIAPGIDGVARIGVVCDAEDRDPGCALQAVSCAFARAFPGAPPLPATGIFSECRFEGRPLEVGAFILPDGKSPGMLEDLCLSACSDREGGVLKCVDQFLDCLAGAQVKQPRWSKRRLHAYLAACDDPTLKVGEAAKAGCWHFEDPVWDPLKHFLLALASA